MPDDVDIFIETIENWNVNEMREFISELLYQHPFITFIDPYTGDMT